MLRKAQARGDFEALIKHGRRILRIHLGGEIDGSLITLKKAMDKALTRID